MAANKYYVACCGNNCKYGYIITVLDAAFCPSFQWTVTLNGCDLGSHLACGTCVNGVAIAFCTNSLTGGQGQYPCTSCCQFCDLCQNYNSRVTNIRTSTQIFSPIVSTTPGGANPCDINSVQSYSPPHKDIIICGSSPTCSNMKCGCALFKQNGENIIKFARIDNMGVGSQAYVETDFYIDKYDLSNSNTPISSYFIQYISDGGFITINGDGISVSYDSINRTITANFLGSFFD